MLISISSDVIGEIAFYFIRRVDSLLLTRITFFLFDNVCLNLVVYLHQGYANCFYLNKYIFFAKTKDKIP